MPLSEHVMSGEEHFHSNGKSIEATVKNFWAWAMSSLMGDGPRGDLAEFIVNTALGVDTKVPKHGWGECDIVYGGIRIEVKSSTYLQAWERDKLSTPTFSIAPTYSCDIGFVDGSYRYIGRDGSPPKRRSDIYVFCLFSETERHRANPLNLDQWMFYVVPTNLINSNLGSQRSISIKGLERIGSSPCTYQSLKSAVDEIRSTFK